MITRRFVQFFVILAVLTGAAFAALVGVKDAGRVSRASGLMGQGEDKGQESGAGGIRPRVRLQLRCAVKDKAADGRAEALFDCESARGRELTRASGAEIYFTLRAENAGTAAARNVVATAPLLAGFTVETASVTGADLVEYSLDGKSFSAQPVIEVGGLKRPAPIQLYRHIRFIWRDIPAGEAREANWTVRIR